jgi:mRNA-degrading endonuclease RelE of RelBE toxin-antitoxin system
MVTFIETRRFAKIVADYLDEEEYALLQRWLVLHPRSGAVIPGSGGVRKLRWGVSARGKRGGLRVIYYLRLSDTEIWMLTIYAKNEAEDIPLDVLRRIREEIDG